MKQFATLIALIFILTPPLLASEWAPNAKQDQRVENLMLRLHRRYDFALPSLFYMKPYSMYDVSLFLTEAIESGKLSAQELEEAMRINSWYSAQKNLFHRSGDVGSININLGLKGRVEAGQDDSLIYRGVGTLNPRLNGNIGKLSFYADMSIFTEIDSDTMWRTSKYEPYQGNPYNLFGREDSSSIRSSDIFRAGVNWQLGKVQFDFGVDHLRSGPARFNPLILNADKSPITYLRTIFDFKWFTYTHTVGQLKMFKDAKKYLYHHRLQFPLFKERVIFGFNEAIVYGSTLDSVQMLKINSDPLRSKYNDIDRTIEPVYMIPFVPYAFAEHFSGDRDNALLSLDVVLKFHRNFHWYCEFLMDDISNPATLFSDDFGNKWAVSVGGVWFASIREHSLTTEFEYTRVEPWTYTHFKGASHNHAHYGHSLGAELGPNSAQINARSKFHINDNHAVAVTFQNSRKDATYRGGDIYHIMIQKTESEELGLPQDSKTKEFLKDPVSFNSVGIEWEGFPHRFFEVTGRVSYNKSSEKKKGYPEIGFWGGFNFSSKGKRRNR